MGGIYKAEEMSSAGAESIREAEISYENRPDFTIIILAYNREKLLPRAIKSVLAQDYSSWECIIINDGSPDKTSEVIAKYECVDKRIKGVNLETNVGVCSARNEGLNRAKGKWISFLADDDEFLPNALSEVLRVANMDDGVNTIHAYNQDYATGERVGSAVSEGYLSSKIWNFDGDIVSFHKQSLIEHERFIPGLRGYEMEFHLRILPRTKRYLTEEIVKIVHTGGDDRLSNSYGCRKYVYEQWDLLLKHNPDYITMRWAAGLENYYPTIVGHYFANGDRRGAKRLMRKAVKDGVPCEEDFLLIRAQNKSHFLQFAESAKKGLCCFPAQSVEFSKRKIVQLLRLLGLKPQEDTFSDL